MKRLKSLWPISVVTALEAEEAVVELLERVFGRPAAVYADAEEHAATVSVYCEQRSEWTSGRRAELMAGLKAIAAAGLKVGAGRILARRLAREDWADSWKRHFKVMEIGTRLLIKPGWVKHRARKGQAVVVLDPGLSFGTGNHPTTAFCLRAVAASRNARQGQSFLDIGTGSGILAIAAAKLGYAAVRALDYDPESMRAARANARKNRVLRQIRFSRRDITKLPPQSRVKFRLICANLTADLLVAEWRRIVNRLQPGGVLVLAGILNREFALVQRKYEQAGLRLAKSGAKGEWRSGVFVWGEKHPKKY